MKLVVHINDILEGRSADQALASASSEGVLVRRRNKNTEKPQAEPQEARNAVIAVATARGQRRPGVAVGTEGNEITALKRGYGWSARKLGQAF
ncbi:hypothetical protein G8D25_18335 [Ralstonia solanacearum]|uniref:hypothetical protein n=1 Tax=Ralstonia solanacearum TaxID=305 RepID=UPI0014497B7C|nr:hypothetical protein [Ralstonia solanacearum]QJC25992.1 hypothetical protein G8D25_18335 [Ralstonia solanacearum]